MKPGIGEYFGRYFSLGCGMNERCAKNTHWHMLFPSQKRNTHLWQTSFTICSKKCTPARGGQKVYLTRSHYFFAILKSVASFTTLLEKLWSEAKNWELNDLTRSEASTFKLLLSEQKRNEKISQLQTTLQLLRIWSESQKKPIFDMYLHIFSYFVFRSSLIFFVKGSFTLIAPSVRIPLVKTNCAAKCRDLPP